MWLHLHGLNAIVILLIVVQICQQTIHFSLLQLAPHQLHWQLVENGLVTAQRPMYVVVLKGSVVQTVRDIYKLSPAANLERLRARCCKSYLLDHLAQLKIQRTHTRLYFKSPTLLASFLNQRAIVLFLIRLLQNATFQLLQSTIQM